MVKNAWDDEYWFTLPGDRLFARIMSEINIGIKHPGVIAIVSTPGDFPDCGVAILLRNPASHVGWKCSTWDGNYGSSWFVAGNIPPPERTHKDSCEPVAVFTDSEATVEYMRRVRRNPPATNLLKAAKDVVASKPQCFNNLKAAIAAAEKAGI